MKTWRQLEAMAKRQGMTINQLRVRTRAIVARDSGDYADLADCRVDEGLMLHDRDRILRAMTEAALKELTK